MAAAISTRSDWWPTQVVAVAAFLRVINALENIRSDVPEGLLAVINRAIRKDPDERFPDMAAMLRALGASAASGRTARPAAPARPGKPRRRRWAPLALAGFVALVISGGGFAVWQQRTSASSSGEPRLAEITVPQDADAGGTAVLDSMADPETATPDDRTARTGAPVREQETGAGAALDPAGAEDPGLATYRRDAEQARDRAQRAREAALGVGADTMFPVRYAQIEGDFNGAQSDLRDGRLVTAAMGFATARGDFVEL